MQRLDVVIYGGNQRINIGVTKPIIVTANDDKDYVMKTYDEENGSKHLVNEFVSYKLAKKLNLPIPPATLLKINKNIIESHEELRSRGIKSELGFGSEYIQRAQPSINKVLLEFASNQDDFPSILLFDQIIYNNDRANNDGNLIFCTRKRKLFIIDHSHIFKDGTIWDENTLRSCVDDRPVPTFDGPNYKLLLEYVSGNSPFHKISTSLMSIDKKQITDIVSSVPPEWHLTKVDSDALIEFVWTRINMLNDIILMIKSKWPYIH